MKYILGFLIISFISVFGVVFHFYTQVRFEAEKLIHYTPKLTTQIFDKHGKLIANMFDKENRVYAKFEEIPSRIIEALVAIEDTMFFEHRGVNLDAILRAIVKDIKARKLVEGASTLTQQLIKTMVLTREKKISRKIKEILLAFEIETILTKEEILERYLNQIYFGHGYYGIRTAAMGYFHKELDDLSLKEMAILVGLPKAPSFYDPTRNFDFAQSRANRVLIRMHSLGWINDSEFQKALEEEPIVYDETLTQNRAPYVVDKVKKDLKKILPDLKSGGYKIYLTLDLDLQFLAKEALLFSYEAIKSRDKKERYTKSLNGAFVALDNSNGDILALVGGVDYKKSHFNRATQTNRQPGSSFKPFIYQIAIDLGYSPSSPVADISRTYKYRDATNKQQTWQPKNYEKDFKGLMPLREALAHSRNLATINLVEDIGMSTLYNQLTEFYGFKNIPENLSISLGSFGISPLDLAEFYSIFASYGNKYDSRLIKSIENRYGQSKSFGINYKKITEKEQAFLTVSMLKSVVDEGTGQSVGVSGIEIAGKTGTTNDNVDAWFCGFSPTIETIAWFGNDNNTPMGRLETGSRAAGPSVKYFFKKLLKMRPNTKRRFDIPKDVIEIRIDGKKEFFTDISKPPKSKIEKTNKIIF